MNEIIWEKKNNIAYITINRPEARNAINAEVWRGLAKAWINVRDDPEVRVAIVTGAGDKAFSAGADMKDMEKDLEQSITDPVQESIPTMSSIDPLRRLNVWKPIIAAINGHCLGAGFFVALSCDIRIAVDKATFGMPEVTFAMSPGMGVTQWLPRLISPNIALQFLVTGERFDAQEAYRIGLVNKVVPQAELMSSAEAIANRIANNGPVAVKAVKEAIWRGLETNLDEGLHLENTLFQSSLQTEDFKEAIQALSQKRVPVFKGN